MSATELVDDLDTALTDEPAPGRTGDSAGARALYDRWENQHWTVAALDFDRDRVVWEQLGPHHRAELLGALAEIEIGEVSVTATLSSLVEHAGTESDQLYLATQLADEARHVLFFQTYLDRVAGVGSESELAAMRTRTDYGHYFDPELRRVTRAVHTSGGDPVSWCTASVYYHLVTEGVLAVTGLRTNRRRAKALELHTLDEGLTNVTRDESRHISFGVLAARRAVATGLAQPLVAAYLDAVGLAAIVLVAPHARQHVPMIRAASNYLGAQLRDAWSTARDRAVRQLGSIGLAQYGPAAAAAFDAGVETGLDRYAEIWGRPHLVRLTDA
ncbi:hypothetical protein [Nocardia sp. alder85J]|uniref:hypothetical protein n=1 Tax=Nocardia sp. alder85J TaxID=2862949 RepID=UPI001CD6B08A|nr:hypothetical protein [Nocardia sp. alder85J]MCX4098516.1 hypothetical protein [Nocardia sp. alder85J]